MSDLHPILRVLGPPALHGPDGEPITFRTRKHFALLIYLALEPQVHRREKLGALLWPSATTAESRHSLATGLSVLRARLGRERVETTRDTARLVSGSLEIDLDRLARGEIHATESTPALAVAPLLQEFVVADAGPWDQWRDALAAKWQPAIRDALLARIDRSRRQGNTRAMELLADALLTLDDLSEDGVRAKMESRAFAGDRLTALQIYEDWRVRLADELGAQPSELVAGMALRLRRRGWERTSAEHIPSVRTDQWKDRPFIGRAEEYQTLYEGWEGCTSGAPRHVLVTGESGVGKSTLVERLSTAAGLQGASYARVQCHAVEREIPYGAIGALIGFLLDRPGASAVAPEWLSELSRTVSAVRRKFPHVAPPSEATGEMVRIRLADALHELVRAIAEEQALILSMDDIHLSDDASVAVMHLLLRRLTTERVLVLCTLRQGDGPLGPSARGMMERAEIANMVVLPLPALTEAESTELLVHLIPAEAPQPTAIVKRGLLRAGSGLPMLLELLVRDWQAHAEQCVALAVGAMTEELRTAGGAGETYRRLLDRLTTDLDPNTRSVLNLSAILGSQLNEFELYGLVDLTMAQAMTGLSQLAAQRILRDGGHGLEFVNEVMRGEVYQTVPSSIRKVLHSKVADRLIERQKGGEEMLGLAIAWHCMRSKRVQEAGEWLILGGKEAIARSALAEAEAALESGYRNLAMPFRMECGALLTEVLIDQGRYLDSHRLASALSESTDATRDFRVESLLHLSSLAIAVAHPSRHEGTLEALLAIASAAQPPDHRLRAATIATALASSSLGNSHLASALGMLSASLEGCPPKQADRYNLMRAQVFYLQRRIGEAEEILARLDALPAKDGPALYRYHLQTGIYNCKVSRGDYADAVACAQQALSIALRAGSPAKERATAANLAVIFLRLGRMEDAYRLACHARDLNAVDEPSTVAVGCLGVELCCLALAGRTRDFELALARGRLFTAGDVNPAIVAVTRLWIADALHLSNRTDEAYVEARVGLATFEAVPVGYLGIAARWAANMHRNHPDPRWTSTLSLAMSHLEAVDMLDRLEITLGALRTLELDSETTTKLRHIAHLATQSLPTHAIWMVGRLGLPYATAQHLPQNTHPTA